MELKSCLEQGYIKYAVWVDRPGVDPDPTLTYNSSNCTHMLVNDGDIYQLESRLHDLACELCLINGSNGSNGSQRFKIKSYSPR